jgi:glutamyl/glutaminyl-tRNA synthetase
MTQPARQITYQGSLTPSPTGHLHLGHARIFGIAPLASGQTCGSRSLLRNRYPYLSA